MLSLRFQLLTLALAGLPGGSGGDDPPEAGQPVEAAAQPGPLVIQRASGLHVEVPRREVLIFDAFLDLEIGTLTVGAFELKSEVGRFVAGLPRPGESATADREVGSIEGRATGKYLGYRLDHLISTRILPQDWPRVIYRDKNQGSSARQRELQYGIQDGQPTSWSRRDHHCPACKRREHVVDGWFSKEHHCSGCKDAAHRIWGEPVTREIPPDAVDMLSAVFLARAMVQRGLDEVVFPLLDRERVWEVTLTRGGRKDVKTRAGTFTCREIRITPAPPEGADYEEKFKGLFGIHGSLHVWLDERSGVPVEIGGTVPLGPLNLDVSVALKAFQGTPDAFRSLEARQKAAAARRGAGSGDGR